MIAGGYSPTKEPDFSKSSGLIGAVHHAVPFLRPCGFTAAGIAAEFVVSRSQAEYASRISIGRKE
jgi:hypothetical protein